MTRVIVLGATGMLGLMLADFFSRQPGLAVTATGRDPAMLAMAAVVLPEVRWLQLEASDNRLATFLKDNDWVVNAIGLIKPYVRDSVVSEVDQAIRINAMFPHRLAHAAESMGVRMIQIATDCVYSGRRGHYDENDLHDAEDVYGKTKSLGEVRSPHVVNLRCSIVGPELRGHRSLLDWFVAQPEGATVTGFTNHQWNGVTTLQFAEVAAAIIQDAAAAPTMHHLVPGDELSKAELLRVFAQVFDRSDVMIVDRPAGVAVDRTLSTQDPAINKALWLAAGYPEPPTIADMARHLADFSPRLVRLGSASSS